MAKSTKGNKSKSEKRSGKVVDRALGPAADEFGKEVAPLGKEAGAVTLKVGRLLLGMVDGAVYGLEYVSEWLKDAVSKRLTQVPPDQIVAPNPRIAVPAVQALVYSMEDEVVRDMFANLLAADMDAKRKEDAHPAFVHMIREMSSADARALSSFTFATAESHQDRVEKSSAGSARLVFAHAKFARGASLMHIDLGREEAMVAANNLMRLGLIDVLAERYDVDRKNDGRVAVESYGICVTPLGYRFARACIPGKENFFSSPFGREK